MAASWLEVLKVVSSVFTPEPGGPSGALTESLLADALGCTLDGDWVDSVREEPTKLHCGS